MTSVAPKMKKVICQQFRLIDFATRDKDGEFIIQVFGLNERGETAAISVLGFRPFFYVKVRDNWTQGNVAGLMKFLKDRAKNSGAHRGGASGEIFMSGSLVEHKKLYGFDGGRKYKFVKLAFNDMRTLNMIKNMWYVMDVRTKSRRLVQLQYGSGADAVELTIYEANIPPLLRYFHIETISPSGWVKVPASARKTADLETTCTFEFVCTTRQVVALPEKETRVPYKICSFDIEASSSHGDFPVPKKSYKKLATNIVDLIAAATTNAAAPVLLKQAIRSAFGMYGEMYGVDLVYPKFAPTEKQLSALIEELLAYRYDEPTAAAAGTAGKNTIEDLFERVAAAAIGGAAAAEDCAAEDGAADDNIFEIKDMDEDMDAEDVDAEDDTPKKPRATKKSAAAAEISIVQILTSTEKLRDEKIRALNDLMEELHFPELEGDKITFIGSTFMNYGEKEPYKNHCFVLGTCDPVEGAIIETTETEKEMLLKWKNLILSENPDIIIGYNIFGFDYEFMYRRAEENYCHNEFLELTRVVGEKSGKLNFRTGAIQDIEQTSVVLATGEYELRYFKMTGRLQIDMYTYMRREFNLPSYKLDDVAGQFIGDDIKRIELSTDDDDGTPTTHLYTKNITGLHVNDYIHIEITGFTTDTYGEKHQIRDIVRGATETYLVIRGHHDLTTVSAKNIRWGLAKDDVSPQDIFRLANEGARERAIVAKYCIQDCNLVHHLLNKIDVITGYVEMSRICSVPISFLVLRGQGIKLTSYVAKKCREKDTLMPDLPKTRGGDGYEGAIVLPPKCSMYIDQPVACVDYASLYPSSMISENLSHDSKVWTKEYDLNGKLIRVSGERRPNGEFIYDNLEGYEYIDIDFDTYQYRAPHAGARAVKTKVGRMVCRWAQYPNGEKAIMPAILEELLRARADTRKQAKRETDPFMQNILDKRQLGYKVTANSLYGQCGAQTSTFYEKDIAASTTATGRKMITYARRIIEEVYGGGREYQTNEHGLVLTNAEYVYGDSVADYTPVFVRYNNHIYGTQWLDIKTIDTIARREEWHKCTELGRQEKEVCDLSQNIEWSLDVWTEHGWTKCQRIIRHKLAAHKKMYRITTPTGVVDVTDDHSLLDKNGAKISPKDVVVGMELLHSANLSAFDNFISEKLRVGDVLSYETQLDAMRDFQHIQCMGYLAQIDVAEEINEDMGDGFYTITIVDKILHPTKITSIQEIPYDNDRYVYDLTTENHHFAAGVGNLIVHNTDSVFFTFNLQNPAGEPIRGKDALEITIEIAQEVAGLCSSYLKAPMELAYEKTLMPFILLSKKRYVGMLYETDPTHGKLKYMGLSLKRRDSCDYLKDTYGNIIKMLMRGDSIQSTIEYLNTALSELASGRVPLEKLMLTRALRSDYKNPQQIAHKVLADRIAKRDPGNKPKSGDRLKFVYIVNPDPRALLGERVETPEFIRANGLKIDYSYYITNQLMKPLQQLFGLAVEQIYIERGKGETALRRFKMEMAKLRREFPDLEVFMKKREAYCSKLVKELLFDDTIKKIQNARAGNREITSFFVRRGAAT